jgi:hypothetical protein
MFEYFPNNYPWSLAVMGALSRGGVIGEVDEACRPLREIAAKKNDPAAQIAWFESWMKVAERVERLGDSDAQKNTRCPPAASTCAPGSITSWPSACRATRIRAASWPTSAASSRTRAG